jgi:hypothetical protein
MIWNMKRIEISGMGKFISGVVVGAVVFSGSAIALNSYVSDNTPENGYLLCANLKTKAVTFPNKLSCPSGTKALDMGAVTGVEGPQGPEGPQGYTGAQGPQGYTGATGPAGSSSSSTLWSGSINSRDIAGTSGATNFSGLKKTIMASLSSANLSGGGNYELTASLTGIWATQSPVNSFLMCYFQDATEYPNGSRGYGAAQATYNSWTGINIVVHGHPSDYSLSKSAVYLVCASDGVISGLAGYLSAIAISNLKGMGSTTPPNS